MAGYGTIGELVTSIRIYIYYIDGVTIYTEHLPFLRTRVFWLNFLIGVLIRVIESCEYYNKIYYNIFLCFILKDARNVRYQFLFELNNNSIKFKVLKSCWWKMGISKKF